MINYQAGELVLVAFPYASGTQVKNRPALVLLDSGDADVFISRVTSQQHRATPYDVPLVGWQAAGLLVAPVVRLHKVATVETARVNQILGRLDATDRQQVAAMLRQMFGAW